MSWFKIAWGALKGAVSQTNVSSIVSSLSSLYLQRAEAQSNEEIARLDAEIELVKIRAEQTKDLQGYWLTAWIRPAYAAVVLVYFAKALLWDAAFHLGVTDPIGGLIEWVAIAVVTFHFATRPFEKALMR